MEQNEGVRMEQPCQGESARVEQICIRQECLDEADTSVRNVIFNNKIYRLSYILYAILVV